MAETALAAAYRAVRSRLAGSGEPWGTQLYGDIIPAAAEFPLVSFFWSGGGEYNGRRKVAAELVLTVKGVAYTQAEAFTLAARIATLLNDGGLYDDSADHLYGGADWDILTCTQEDAVHIVDMWSGALPIFHDGARYRLVMEVK
jgi:hypothetical protein